MAKSCFLEPFLLQQNHREGVAHANAAVVLVVGAKPSGQASSLTPNVENNVPAFGRVSNPACRSSRSASGREA